MPSDGIIMMPDCGAPLAFNELSMPVAMAPAHDHCSAVHAALKGWRAIQMYMTTPTLEPRQRWPEVCTIDVLGKAFLACLIEISPCDTLKLTALRSCNDKEPASNILKSTAYISMKDTTHAVIVRCMVRSSWQCRTTDSTQAWSLS